MQFLLLILVTEVVYGEKVKNEMIVGHLGLQFTLGLGILAEVCQNIFDSLGQHLKVMMPDSCIPSYLPYWNRNSDTGEITGYLVDLLEEISKSVGFNYTLEDSSEFVTYHSLGKMTKKFLKNNKLF